VSAAVALAERLQLQRTPSCRVVARRDADALLRAEAAQRRDIV